MNRGGNQPTIKYKAVIFDLDGLITDTEIVEHRSFEMLLKEYGKEPQFHANGFIHVVGGGPAYYEDFKEKYSLTQDVETIKETKRSFFEEIIKNEGVAAFPGFLELLQTLKQAGFKLAVASNRNEKFVCFILDTLKAKDFFSVIVGPNDDRRHKPFPDMYVHAIKELGLKPEDCIVLEDSRTGVISAKEAGAKVIVIPNIHTQDQDFSRADKVVSSLLDVNIELLDSI